MAVATYAKDVESAAGWPPAEGDAWERMFAAYRGRMRGKAVVRTATIHEDGLGSYSEGAIPCRLWQRPLVLFRYWRKARRRGWTSWSVEFF